METINVDKFPLSLHFNMAMLITSFDITRSGIWKREDLIMLKIWRDFHLIVRNLLFSRKEISIASEDRLLVKPYGAFPSHSW